jgi:hypothetical protein
MSVDEYVWSIARPCRVCDSTSASRHPGLANVADHSPSSAPPPPDTDTHTRRRLVRYCPRGPGQERLSPCSSTSMRLPSLDLLVAPMLRRSTFFSSSPGISASCTSPRGRPEGEWVIWWSALRRRLFVQIKWPLPSRLWQKSSGIPQRCMVTNPLRPLRKCMKPETGVACGLLIQK